MSGNTIGCGYTLTNHQTCQYQCSDGQCVTPSTTTVSGYFKKSNGNGISNVKFKLEDCGNHAVRAYDNTDSSGYYSMNAAAGNYQLAADYLGFDIHFGSCTNFVGTVNIADITLKASLSGYTKYSSGSGRSGVVVRLKDCSNNLINSQTTNSNGYYQVSASDAGNYKVTMELLGQEFEVLGCQPMIENMQAPDAVFDASLSGYVKNGNGVGKSNVLMKLTTCGGTTVASTTTDNTGYFTLHAADAGSFDLIMNYQGKNYEIIDCAQIVGTTSLQNPITLSAAISGTITDNAGNGKSNLNVKLTDCSGNAIHVAKTNSNGYFKVLSAEPGSFDLYFDYNGYTFQLLDCYPVFGEVSFQNPIKLSTKLYGYLHDLNSNPLKDYAVELYDCSENFVKSGLTGSNGYFSITENAGKYKIFIDIGSGWKTKLIDDKNNDCHFLIGDINLGTLKINPSVDCSVYNYKCYQGNIKLFNCYWDKANRVCACYGTPCDYGCTDGKQDCDAAKTGVVVIDVDDVTDNPIHGARIFLNDKYQGATDGNGKLNVAAPLGYQTFEADCPDQSFCGKKQVYVDGTKYLYFDCNCKNLDSDGDTLTDEEERIIGLDPYNSQSNLISGYTDMDISTSCFDFKPLFSGLFSEQEINRFIQNINGSGQNYQMLFETAISPRALQTMYGLDSRKLVTDSRKTMAMLKESSKIQYVSSGASAVLIMTDDISGVTSIFPIAAACAGQIIGVLAGAGFGLKDDFEGVFTLGKTLLTGLWHIITRQKKISSLWDDVVNVVKAIGSILKNADKLVHDMTMGIFGKGKWVLDIVNAKTGSDEYLSFQLGFFSGYVVGYVVEQIALFEAILSKASQVFTKIAQGTKLGKAITNVAKALERIGSKFGGRVAESLSNLKIWNAAASWADEVQDGLAILAKNIDESWFAQKSSSYLERISKSVSELYNSLDVSLRPALDGLLKNNGLRDKILPLFEAWDTAVKARRGLVRIFEEFGDSALDSLLKKYTDTNVLKSIAQTADTLLSSGKVNGLSKTVKLNIVEEIGLIGTKYGDAVADDLIKNSDVFLKAAQTPDGKSIFLRKGNIEVVVEYVDDGGGYLKKIGINIADTSNANKGKIGEIITDNIARKQGWGEVVPGFMKDNTNQIGIDRIYKKGDTYILVESKFTSDTNLQNVGRSILDTTTDYGKQMSDAWIQNAVDTMLNDNIITPQLAAELKKAIPANIRKKLVVVKNSPPTGYTVLDDLETYIDPVSNTALGIKDVSIINIGKVI